MTKISRFVLISIFLSVINVFADIFDVPTSYKGFNPYQKEVFNNSYKACLSDSESSNEDCLTRAVLAGTFANSTTIHYSGELPPPDRSPPADQQSGNAIRTDHPTPPIRQRVDRILSDYEQKCEPIIETTNKCCGDPLSCLSGSSGDSTTRAAMMLLKVSMGSATENAAISQNCSQFKTLTSTQAAINTAFTVQCSAKIAQCRSTCGALKKEAEEILSDCTSFSCNKINSEFLAYYNANSGTNDSPALLAQSATSQVRSELKKITRAGNECEAAEEKAAQQAQQAIASTYAAKIAGLCQKQAQVDPVANNAFNVNCADAQNAANPVCQNQCNRAGAENDPICRQMWGLGGGSGFGQGINGIGGLGGHGGLGGIGSGATDLNKAEAGAGGIDEFENMQEALDANIRANENKAKVGNQAGGGIPGGAGGGTGGGGADPYASGGAGGEGLNTNIMGGVSSRPGYTQPLMRGSPAGGGYSAPSARTPASAQGKPFNPKDFLPGAKNDPKRRIAGLAATTPEIGAVHGDIFRNITNRFLQVCLRDALYDCESVRKNQKLGN